MGIFNFFIVLPEIIASLFFGKIMENFLHNDRLLAVQTGGALLIVAGIVCAFIVKKKKQKMICCRKLSIACILSLLLLNVHAQSLPLKYSGKPVVYADDKPAVYPTHWFTGMKYSRVQLLLHGKDIRNYQVIRMATVRRCNLHQDRYG